MVPLTVSVRVCLPLAGIVPLKGGLLAVHVEFVLRALAIQVEPDVTAHVSVSG
jgi:hypothetical protein